MVDKGVIGTNTLKFLKAEIYQNTTYIIHKNTADFVQKKA